MPVKGDLEYFKNLGEEEFNHSVNKPWSDDNCGRYLMELGAMMGLMPRRGKLLDLGCGTGWTSFYFAKMGYDVVGQDVAPEAISYAQCMAAKTGMANLSFLESDYETLQLKPDFDIAIFFDALHHALDETKAVTSAFRALKPGGLLLTSEPGIGHARRSRSTIQTYGVTERDMPPRRIIKAGKAAGFTSFKVYPHAQYLYTALYRTSRSRILGQLLDLWGTRNFVAMLNIYVFKHVDGIVVLKK